MSSRGWFYLLAFIIIAGLISYLHLTRSRVASELRHIEQSAVTDQAQAMDSYLAKQTDGRKLVSLAKNLPNADPILLEKIILRAQTLLPNDRDVAILASTFKPELEAKVKELDPLYGKDF